jgi:DNA-binding NarL/FixJ family response regulator
MHQTTIMLADDHPVVRLGLKTLLEQERDFNIVGETFDGIETVRSVQRLDPDVLVLDLMMPGMNGMYVMSEVKKSSPRTRIIILTMHAGEPYVREAFQRGADGYVLKDSIAGEIVQAIRTVKSGGRYLGELLTDGEAVLYTQQKCGDTHGRYDSLTKREREILYLLAKGMKNKEIAVNLGISTRTAECHRAHIMRKLNLRNPVDLAHFALQNNIVVS